jgi:hypothetical protein
MNGPVAVVETNVFGAKAYHCRCLNKDCRWESKRYDKENQAVNKAQHHCCKTERLNAILNSM